MIATIGAEANKKHTFHNSLGFQGTLLLFVTQFQFELRHREDEEAS
jgi:hypothetical protein